VGTDLPKPLKAAAEAFKNVKGICFDLDDTFTTEGQILPEAYEALWLLKRAGFKLVPVTGRPAGWCDLLVRFFPVDAVVGENGAFVFWLDENSVKRRFDTVPEALKDARTKLPLLKTQLEKSFPGMKVASDQAYREYDLAVDIAEGVPRWSEADIDRLIKEAEATGAHAKLSNIHVNIWYGEFNKYQGFKSAVLEARGPQGLPSRPEEWVYVGDSPNDEPLFEKFPGSVGVANVTQYFPKMKRFPKFVTEKPCGLGFRELADFLLSLKP
jgi:HAD superfamily hydrolase (TIGR01484 family)